MRLVPSALAESVSRWLSLWGLHGLGESVNLRFSTRLKQGLGRCYPRRRLITLAAHLENLEPSLVGEVLCHELAHLAVYEVHGKKCRPHGPEWAKLMHIAGFIARARLPLEASENPSPSSYRRYFYVHRCPVCQTGRIAYRSVRGWRCAACLALGLDGRLNIERYPAPQRES